MFCPFQFVSPKPRMPNLCFLSTRLTFSNFPVIFRLHKFHVPIPSLSLLPSRFTLSIPFLFPVSSFDWIFTCTLLEYPSCLLAVRYLSTLSPLRGARD